MFEDKNKSTKQSSNKEEKKKIQKKNKKLPKSTNRSKYRDNAVKVEACKKYQPAN